MPGHHALTDAIRTPRPERPDPKHLPAMNRLLRDATRDDMPAIWEVRYAVTENQLEPGRISDEMLRIALEEWGHGWVAEVDGRIEGFAIGLKDDGHLWALFVHPRAQGQGLGSALHDRLLQWWFEQGVDELWLNTGADTRARRFYERRGWVMTGPAGPGEVRLAWHHGPEWQRQPVVLPIPGDPDDVRP
ncbi:MAG: GNAT family N-acetyltransferase [Burkholderiaceae bacterium]|nr:MAG: GNAT family N-acetyltransferase [Burkholderiaceae bacterium]